MYNYVLLTSILAAILDFVISDNNVDLDFVIIEFGDPLNLRLDPKNTCIHALEVYIWIIMYINCKFGGHLGFCSQ